MMDRRRSSSSSLSSPAGSSDDEDERRGSGEDSDFETPWDAARSGSGSPIGRSGSETSVPYGVEEDEDDDDEEDDDDLNDFPSVHRSPPPAITWPPPVADNSNRLPSSKKRKPGIVYLSSIPPGFNVSRTTGFFSQYGRVGRVFLQPDERSKPRRDKDKVASNRAYSEGWIEFMSKKLAKEVAANLNLSPVGGKKRSKSHDVLWNVKYLPGFKWTHLSERLAYEKAVHQQRMRTEISQVKRESEFFKTNVEKSKRLKRKGSLSGREPNSPPSKKRAYEFRQKETDEEIRRRKAGEVDDVLATGSRKRKPSVADSSEPATRTRSNSSGSAAVSVKKAKVGSKTSVTDKKSIKSSKQPKNPKDLKAKVKDSKKSSSRTNRPPSASGKKSDRVDLLKALI